MDDFLFYTVLGFRHVADLSAIDHMLFLAALALPFSFRRWQQLVILVTIFTITHCFSLFLSVYGLVQLSTQWIEFLIPLTIALTALMNLRAPNPGGRTYLPGIATAFFGLIHGFGFSNYFNMLMTAVEAKEIPLLGFAFGIELSQLLIIFGMLILQYLLVQAGRVPRQRYLMVGSIIVALSTIPMLVNTFPL